MKLQMTRKLRFSAVLFAAAFCLFFSGCEYLDSFLNELNGQDENKTEEQKENNETFFQTYNDYSCFSKAILILFSAVSNVALFVPKLSLTNFS